MANITVGLIPSPDMPHKIINKIYTDLPNEIRHHTGGNDEWHIEKHIVSIVGTAEHMDKAMDITTNMKKQKAWDYAICITDLPNLSNNKTVVCDIDLTNNIALISLPALGAINLKQKLRNFISFVIQYMHSNGSDNNLLNSQHFKLTKFTTVTPNEEDKNKNHLRIISTSTFIGWLHLISGMTFANEPWSTIFDFKKIISVSFATGTYISIFSTPWDISLDYDYWRFILLMFMSIFGMVGWLIYSYNLWERKNPKTQKLYRYIYNFTTLTTLTVITLFNFITLFLLLTISTLLFVPPELFSNWTSLGSKQPTLINYINLIWFITSLGILAGAMGSTVENDDKIKRATYSFRQYYRNKQLEQENDADYNNDEESNDYAGRKQTHREEEE
ncbi:MAG: hypothetical protein ACTIBX_03070 [Staphylococcus saprophyticus]